MFQFFQYQTLQKKKHKKMVNHWNKIAELLANVKDYVYMEDGTEDFRQVKKNTQVKFSLAHEDDVPAIFDSVKAKWASGGKAWVTISSRMFIDKVMEHLRQIPKKFLRKRYVKDVRFMQSRLSKLHETLTQEHLAIPFHGAFMESCMIANIIFDRPLPLKEGARRLTPKDCNP